MTPEDIRLEPPPVLHVDVLDVYLFGGFNPPEKYESVGMMKFPIYGKS